MKVRAKGDFIWTLVLSVFVAALILATGGLLPEVRIVPYLAAIPTLILLLLLLLGEFVPGVLQWTESTLEDLWGGDGRRPGGAADETPAPWPAVLRVMGWIVGFLVLFFWFGFFVVPPIFIAAYLVVEAKVAARKAVPVALLVCGSLYGGLSFLMVELWTGAVPEIITDYVGGAIIPPV